MAFIAGSHDGRRHRSNWNHVDRVQFSLRNETREPRIEGGELTFVLHGEGEKHGIRNLTEPLYARGCPAATR